MMHGGSLVSSCLAQSHRWRPWGPCNCKVPQVTAGHGWGIHWSGVALPQCCGSWEEQSGKMTCQYTSRSWLVDEPFQGDRESLNTSHGGLNRSRKSVVLVSVHPERSYRFPTIKLLHKGDHVSPNVNFFFFYKIVHIQLNLFTTCLQWPLIHGTGNKLGAGFDVFCPPTCRRAWGRHQSTCPSQQRKTPAVFMSIGSPWRCKVVLYLDSIFPWPLSNSKS